MWLAWIPGDGAYFPAAWYPSAAVALALLPLTILVRGRWLPRPGAAQAALLGFAALVALNYLSILWAAGPADALQASNKLLLYLVIAWTLSLLPWTPASLAWMLGLWSAGVAVVCAAELLHVTSVKDLGSFFYGSRYATPLLYPNATAALPAMALWPALLLSARRGVPAWARIPLLAVAAFLAGFAFLPQSRGTLLGLAVTAPVVLLAAQGRIALLVRMAVMGGVLAVTIPRTVRVYQALSAGHPVRPVLDHAAQGILFTTLAALAVSALLVFCELRLLPARMLDWRPPRPTRRGRTALALGGVVLVLGGGVAAAPAVSRLASSVWHSGRTDASVGSVRLLSATPEERFDYVRASWRMFKGAPLVGVGAGNFGRHYDTLRTFEKHSNYTHDLVLRVLTETGLAGLAMLLVVFAGLGWGMLRSALGVPGLGRSVAVSTIAIALYFLIHASLDWMDEFPVLAAPALALALATTVMQPAGRLATASTAAQAPGAAPVSGRRRLRALPVGDRPIGLRGAALMLVLEGLLAVALAGPYLEGRYEARALKVYRAHPAVAYRDLGRAAGVNTLSSQAYVTEGKIAVALVDDARASDAFRKAIARNDGWFPRLELGVLLAQSGRFGPALHQVRVAASLDRDDPLVSQATTMIMHRRAIDPLAFNTGLLGGAQADVFKQQSIR